MDEVVRLRWENELYALELERRMRALKSIHRVIQVTPNNIEALEMILEREGV